MVCFGRRNQQKSEPNVGLKLEHTPIATQWSMHGQVARLSKSAKLPAMWQVLVCFRDKGLQGSKKARFYSPTPQSLAKTFGKLFKTVSNLSEDPQGIKSLVPAD